MSWWKSLFAIGVPTSQPKKTFDTPEEYDLPLSEQDDPLYFDAIHFVVETRRASTSVVQRKFNIGYNRAAMLVECMERDGIISTPDSNGNRRITAPGLNLQSIAKLRLARAAAEAQEHSRRQSYLMEKYQDEETVRRITERTVWEGMTSAQLFDALGEPKAVDQKYLKKASREVWKYLPQGTNRYAAKITLENGVVVGWDFKE